MPSLDADLGTKITRIEQLVLALARSRYSCAKVFSIGATDIDPKHFAVWITTDTDAQRDDLTCDHAFRARLVGVLHEAAYPEAAIAHVGFAFESQETVKRDFEGDWWSAIK